MNQGGKVAFASDRPIFLELSDAIAADVLAGLYPEESQVPSTTELAAYYRINPATAGKALNRLVDAGVVYKKRGVGMFVTSGAPDALRQQRRSDFHAEFIAPLLSEAQRLGLTSADIVDLITKDTS
jgi:DNA-binding transcriptional regulator YhcF (GntR family)